MQYIMHPFNSRNVNINLQHDFCVVRSHTHQTQQTHRFRHRLDAHCTMYMYSNANWFHLSDCTRASLLLVGWQTSLPKHEVHYSIDWILLMANRWGKFTNRTQCLLLLFRVIFACALPKQIRYGYERTDRTHQFQFLVLHTTWVTIFAIDVTRSQLIVITYYLLLLLFLVEKKTERWTPPTRTLLYI